MSKEEVFLRNNKKTSKNWKINFNHYLEDQKWIYYSTMGSFALLIILNFLLPDISVTKVPFDLGEGLVSVFMIFIGTGFLITFFSAGAGSLKEIFISLLGLAISLVLLYFGFPILFGFAW
jgi:hypothetical protein